MDSLLQFLTDLLASSSGQHFELPPAIDFPATFLWAVSGALVAARRGYDINGIVVLALVSSTGGGLLRDGIFLQQGPPALVRSPFYLALVVVAALLVLLAGRRIQRIRRYEDVVALGDAIGLGAYAVVGMTLADAAGLDHLGVVLVGVVNAVGGGVLRDVLMRREAEIFQPGTLLAVAAVLGCILFLALTEALRMPETPAGWLTILVVFAVRALAVRLNWRTRPALGFEDGSDEKP